MPEPNEFQIRWTRSFLRADAEQPTGTLRMLLSVIRRNQWVLLDWTRAGTNVRFYPFTKGELTPRLENALFDTPVIRALRLEERPSSQTIESDKIKLFTGTPQNTEEPWLPRKVLLGPAGTPIAIGIPRVPRADGEIAPASRQYIDHAILETEVFGKEHEPEPDTPSDYSIVRIFYGTDRAKGADGSYTGSRRSDEQLSVGTCDVTIPRDRRMGAFESPRWWRFEFRKNPRRYITLHQVNELSATDFFSMLQSSVSADSERTVFVFVHGFCVSFEDAARRTAQLSYDLGFKGAPVLYSWPSAGYVAGYFTDEATIEWAKPHLLSFLNQIAMSSGASRIHVIAHSMGNRALIKDPTLQFVGDWTTSVQSNSSNGS